MSGSGQISANGLRLPSSLSAGRAAAYLASIMSGPLSISREARSDHEPDETLPGGLRGRGRACGRLRAEPEVAELARTGAPPAGFPSRRSTPFSIVITARNTRSPAQEAAIDDWPCFPASVRTSSRPFAAPDPDVEFRVPCTDAELGEATSGLCQQASRAPRALIRLGSRN
jgi:hypothetical protein